MDRLPAVGLAVGQKSADRQIVSDRLDHLSVLRVGDEGVDACVADDEDQLRPGQAEVERHEDGAEARRCEHRLEERRLVQADEADPVAVAHATEAEMVCQTVDPVLHLAIRPGRTLKRQCSSIRRGGGPCSEPMAEADVGLHGENL